MTNFIILIGYRGVGKSTVGKQLADLLGFDFIDTDSEICRSAGETIADLIERIGWDGFRHLEKKVLQQLTGTVNAVVSTGGGAVLHHSEWQTLKKEATIIWLDADEDVIVKRLSQDDTTRHQRPSLTAGTANGEVKEMLRRRLPLYAEIAHHRIDTGRLDIDGVVTSINRIAELPRT